MCVYSSLISWYTIYLSLCEWVLFLEVYLVYEQKGSKY